MKTKTRMQMADGFALIGTIGMLATAFLVPAQWLSGQVRVEAQIGSLVSLLCVILAALAARSVIFGLKVLFSTLLVASLGYLAVVLFAASGAGWNGRVAVLVGGLVVVAAATGVVLWRLRRAAPQQCVQASR